MSRLLTGGLLLSAGILGFIAGGGYIERQNQFDYESCRAIVAKGDPMMLEHWHETGGNWCIR